MASREENDATSHLIKKPPELKDLNDSVLSLIFKHLSIIDLVNIVDYDNDLKANALSAFKEKIGKDAATVTNEFNPLKETLSTSMKLLNYFGNDITKLVVKYHENYREISKVINDTIISRCCKTLEEIEFQNAGRFTMYGICEHFENVHTVSFLRGYLSDVLSQFSKWFPKAHTLKLNWQQFDEDSDWSIMENNPSLKHLEIGKISRDSTDYLEAFIERSPELKTLRIEFGKGDMSLEDTLIINISLQNLESLHLKFRKAPDIFNRQHQRARFGRLKHLTIESTYVSMKGLTITAENLQTLKVIASEGLGEGFVDFFNDNSNVEVVELLGSHIANVDAVISSLAKLSNLKEVEFPFPSFYNNALQLDQVHVILKECKRLCKLTITAKHIDREKIPIVESSMNTFAASVDVQWDGGVLKEVVTIYERFFKINFRLVLEKNNMETQTGRMELRMKRKYPVSSSSKKTHKRRRTEIKQLELEDLNDDCLIMIFKHLSIDDLVNIVEYNNHFKTAALIVFKQKYGDDSINVSVEYNSITKDALWSVKLLKHFGSEITRLNVKYYNEDSLQIDDSIDNAVLKYCHKSLVEIEFTNSKSSTMHGIKKPFMNVRTVSFNGGFVSETVYNLGKWFPTANTLKLTNMNEPKEANKIHIKNAPALEHFEIRFRTSYDYVSDDIYQKIIESNPQLKSLYHEYDLFGSRRDYYMYENHDDVRLGVDDTFVNLPMPNLESLHLVLPHEKRLRESDTDYNKNGKFHFEKLKHLHIEFKESGVLKDLPISTNNLETLILTGLKKVKASDCVNFIRDNQNVKSVKITGSMMNGFHSDIGILCDVFPTLPNLVELEISYKSYFNFFPVSFHIADLLTGAKLLYKLVVNCDSEDNTKEIEQKFNSVDDAIKSQWTISNDMTNSSRYSITFDKNSL